MSPERNCKFTVFFHAKATLSARQARSLSGTRQESNTVLFPTFPGVISTRGRDSGPPRRLSSVNIFHSVTGCVHYQIVREFIRAEVRKAVGVRVTQHAGERFVRQLDTIDILSVNFVIVEKIPRDMQTHRASNLCEFLRAACQSLNEVEIGHAVERVTGSLPLVQASERGQGVTALADQMRTGGGARFAHLAVSCAHEASFAIAALFNSLDRHAVNIQEL